MKRVIRASNNVTNYVAGVMDVNISYYMVVSCFLCGFHDNSDGEASSQSPYVFVQLPICVYHDKTLS